MDWMAAQREYERNLKESKKQEAKEWNKNHPKRVKQTQKKYYQTHKEQLLAKAKIKRNQRNHRVPSWFNELDELVMQEAEALRQWRSDNLGEPYEIDHIIPLKGKLVSGLHVYNNVQVIPKKSNRSKSNSYGL